MTRTKVPSVFKVSKYASDDVPTVVKFDVPTPGLKSFVPVKYPVAYTYPAVVSKATPDPNPPTL